MKRIPISAMQNNEGLFRNVAFKDKQTRFLTRLLSGLRRLWRSRPSSLPPSAAPQDPFAWSPAGLPTKPKQSGGAVAVAEPDDEYPA